VFRICVLFYFKYVSRTPLQPENHFLSGTYWWARQDSNLGPRDYEEPYLIVPASASRRILNAFPVPLPVVRPSRTYPEHPVEIPRTVSRKTQSGSSSCGAESTEPGRSAEVGRNPVGGVMARRWETRNLEF
jgi:hypothetical protein